MKKEVEEKHLTKPHGLLRKSGTPKRDGDDQSWISEGVSSLGIVASSASPVTCQRPDRPEQRKKKKQFAPRDTRAPGPECAQGWHDGGRRHPSGPHNRSGNRAGLLHRGLLRLHSKERKMFEQPTEPGRPTFWIPGTSERVKSEANAKQSSHHPVGNGMAAEIEENPSHNHGEDGSRGGTCGSRRSESKISCHKPSNLHRISEDDRKPAEDFALRNEV